MKKESKWKVVKSEDGNIEYCSLGGGSGLMWVKMRIKVDGGRWFVFKGGLKFDSIMEVDDEVED